MSAAISIPCGIAGCGLASDPILGLPFRCNEHSRDGLAFYFRCVDGRVWTSHDGSTKCDCSRCIALDISRDNDAVNRAVAALYPALAKHGGNCTEAMRDVLAAAAGGGK